MRKPSLLAGDPIRQGGGQEGIDSLPVALDGECRFVSRLFVFWRTLLVLRLCAKSLELLLNRWSKCGTNELATACGVRPSFFVPKLGQSHSFFSRI